jgi:hypothetical protein
VLEVVVALVLCFGKKKKGERLPDGWGAAAGCFGGEKSKLGKGGCLEKKIGLGLGFEFFFFWFFVILSLVQN